MEVKTRTPVRRMDAWARIPTQTQRGTRRCKLAAIRAADHLQRNVPETVAQLTGGEYFKFENGKSLVRGLLTISNHVPNRYVLSFQPQFPHAGFHAVELKLFGHPGLLVTARSGYWADADGVPAVGP